jgi:hypothetical protein
LICSYSGSRNIKETKNTMSTTYILENLQPDSSYEVYVQARNFYGTGAPTTRIVFRTASKTVVDLAKTGTLKCSVYPSKGPK